MLASSITSSRTRELIMAVVSLTRRLVATLAVAVAALGMSLAAASPAAAAGGGYVRLAHLVPDKIACDMYLQLHSVSGNVVKFLPSVKYGTISDYVMVPAGTYAVAMRGPGADAKSAPVLSTVLTVADGHAYTVGRMGSPDHAEARIIEDDRTLPTGDQAKLRVVQAAQRTLNVTVADGPVVAKDVAFTTATAYQGIEPGTKTLRVQPAGGQATSIQTTITAGSIYSLLILQGDDGKLSAAVLTDAKRSGTVPHGGVNTGGGGTANPGGNPLTSPTTVAALLLVIAAAGLTGAVLIGRRYLPAADRARR
jgi:hypothetical protein